MERSTANKRIELKEMKSRAKTVVIAITVLFALSGCASRHHPSEVHPYRTVPFQENSIDLSGYKSPQMRDSGQDPNTAFAIAISGGGHRATNFGVGVMIELEKIKNTSASKTNALNEIDYFSTVSGGGLAAAAYLSSLHDHYYFSGSPNSPGSEYSFGNLIFNGSADKNPHSQITNSLSDPQLKNHLSRGYHKDLLEGLFAWTVATRGEFLERAFDDQILGRNFRENKQIDLFGKLVRGPSLTLGDVFISGDHPDRPVLLPYWIANATVYENGSIFPFTPDFLRLYKITGYKHRLKPCTFDASCQTYDSFIDNVPLALGLTASGNFPVLIPATTLQSSMDPMNPYLHLLDGGMADNLGVISALRLLGKEQAKRRILIVVDAFKENVAPFSNTPKPPIMADTAFRAMDISLDSWRGRAREIIKALNSSQLYGPDIKTIYISFDDLRELETFDELFRFGLTHNDLNCLKDEGSMDDVTVVNPYSLVRTVKTRYNLSKAEQNLLFAAGRYITNKKSRQIKEHLNWTEN